MCKIETTHPELSKIWNELTSIFLDYKCMTQKIIKRLETIGFKVIQTRTHIKIVMPVGTMVISSTPSDKNAGRQILRQIRRMYESSRATA